MTVHDPEPAADQDRGGEDGGADPAYPRGDDGEGTDEAVLRHEKGSQLDALGELARRSPTLPGSRARIQAERVDRECRHDETGRPGQR